MKINLINGNSLEELYKMKENSIDYVITSPPYNMNLRISKGKYISRQIVKEISTKYEGFSDNLSMDEYFDFNKKIINQLLRITKNQIFYNIQFLTGNKVALFKLIGYFSDKLKEVIIWDKKYGQPAIGKGVLNSQYEVILVLSNKIEDSIKRKFDNSNFQRGTLSNLWYIQRGKSKLKGHAATFPEKLVETIILNFTQKNQIILDPFMGTGTTGIVCKKYERKFIGIELLKTYFNFSKKLLESRDEYGFINDSEWIKKN